MTQIVPAVPEGRYVDVPHGLRVHYHEAGDGPAVVFVHGSGPGASGWSNFRHNYEWLAAQGYRCVVPDLPGYGYSTRTPDAAYSWESVVDAITGLCDGLGLKDVTLVGNSMGGAICIQAALNRPELITRLVLMAPGGLEERETYMGMKGIRTMLGILYGGGAIDRDAMRRLFRLQLFNESLITDEIIEERFQVFETQPPNILGMIKVPNLASRTPELGCPILALWGVNDQFCPVSGGYRLVEQCSNTRLVVLSECGHWVMVEHADVFNRTLLDFLQNG